MIRTANLNDKTYEERINEAVASIPIYTDEWTNYNPSDPGITIIENLSLFETLQQENINELPIQVKANLLKMAGFVPAKGKCARLYVQPKGVQKSFVIPKGHRFYAYDMPFEATKPITVNPIEITGVFNKTEDEINDISYIANSDIRISAAVFSEKPASGVELYFVFNELPSPQSEMLFYVTVKNSKIRNPIDEADRNLFATIKWEYYTQDGFKPMHSKDNTFGFVKNGEIKLRLGDEEGAIYSEMSVKGYCIRATLEQSTYDVVPYVKNIFSNLFEICQLQSKSFSFNGSKASDISFLSSIENNNYITVFVKEEKGSSYKKYEPFASPVKEKGRYYTIGEDEEGYTSYRFDKSGFGYGPEKGRSCVRVLVYNEEIMKQYKLGTVLGYDNQEIILPVNHIVNESFFVVAKTVDENGGYKYDFVRPGRSEDGNMYYLLNDRDGVMVIKDAGDYIGAELFMGGCAVYHGHHGNIREGNILKTEGLCKGVTFMNPAKGFGGTFPEDLESVRSRFIADIDRPYTAITAADYELLALTTPGLIVRKAAAHFDESGSRVYVAVLPGDNKNKYPLLSDDYIGRISARLNERRLLITKSKVIRTVPVKVNVRATVYVKPHFDNCEDTIVKAVYDFLNYVDSDKRIGECVKFDEVFKSIESLSCVEYVHSLNIRAAKSTHDQSEDMDIKPIWNGLVVPGNISIDVVTYNS